MLNFTKMKSYHILLLTFLALWLGACNQQKKAHFEDAEGHIIDEVRYSNGQVKSRIFYLDQNGADYIQTSYYENGVLQDSMVFKNNKPEGTKKYYDEISGLTHYENYRNGIMQGINEAIYNNGISSYSGYRHQGFKAGEWVFHYPDGRPITYEFYDSTGHLKYLRKYDESGYYQQTEGSIIIDAAISESEINAGDSVMLQVLLANPPGSSTTIEISGNVDNEAPVKSSILADKSRMEIPIYFEQKGKAKIDIYVTVLDNNSEHSETDHKTFNLDVI